MTISILQAVFGLILGWVAIRMGNHPPKEDKDRQRYKTAFWLFGGLLFLFNIIQIFQTNIKETASVQSMTTISGNQTNLDNTFKAKIGVLESNLSYSQSEQRKIEMMFATNSTYDPYLRERVIASHENVDDISLQADDLKLWVASLNGRYSDREALQKIEHEKSLQKNRVWYETGFKYFDYAAGSLTNMLTKIAKLKGDKFVIQSNGLPTVLDDVPSNLTNMKLENTAGWEFRFVWEGDPALRIFSGESCLCINGGGTVDLTIPGLPMEEFQITTNNYKQPLEEHLKLMIAYRERSLKSKP